MTTHYMEEASHCNQLAFIYGGRLVAEGTPQQIREQATGQRIPEVTVANPDAALELIGNLPEVVDAYLSAATVHAVLQPHTDEREVAGSLIDALQSQGHREVSVVPAEPTIDDAFVSLVSSQRATRVTAECAQPPAAAAAQKGGIETATSRLVGGPMRHGPPGAPSAGDMKYGVDLTAVEARNQPTRVLCWAGGDAYRRDDEPHRGPGA